ncbi:MAG: type III-A CRISPR-associated RAMP protein Csm4 [Acholeplasmatales bacterium]|jgi:CRISPR-associated protein Csm4|nr:type III-A CRISPR-associated RAMP protein Csm4 [Acholeplasmataceae bacterium]MCK9293260.1 type III-A CRISPR-associated RAMP protein Csm4 [archaeon]MCK9439457.1 type III-A CRISPR-associated RAMP protein Csm4 [Patescibacteria group bacterium]MDY0115917.1 type III-A CRISPR-associated RAMP protein Csm4 [Acholeplasmatales bacterium]
MNKKKIITLKFNTAIHYGNDGKPGLLNTDIMILSDTVYSAIIDNNPTILSKLIKYVTNNELKISNMLPYVNNQLLLPRGLKQFEFGNKEIDRTLFKKMKKVNFLPFDNYEKYYTNCQEELIEEALNLEKEIGVFEVRTNNRISRDKRETMPYLLTTFTFNENSGLYLIVEYSDENIFALIKNEIERLGKFGVGGRRSSGLGKFVIKEIKDFQETDQGKYLLVSTALPKNPIGKSTFKIVKRSGFYHSREGNFKKRDIYAISSGLITEEKFEGKILDDLSFNHPVYRFLPALFVRINI